jgi:hypothetical protein
MSDQAFENDDSEEGDIYSIKITRIHTYIHTYIHTHTQTKLNFYKYQLSSYRILIKTKVSGIRLGEFHYLRT